MKVILLAAGQSKRLKPIEDKNFLAFLGKPLIELQIGQLIKAGLKDIVLIGGAHNLRKLATVCKKFARNAKIKLLEQKDLSQGMAGALLSAEKLVGKEPILVVSANDIVDLKAYQLILSAAKSKVIVSIFESFLLAKKVEKYFPGGYLEIQKDAAISGIVEKPGEGNEPSDLVNLVVHYHRNSRSLFEALHQTKTSRDDHYEAAMDVLIKSGHKMKAIAYDGFWKPIKYPWDILEVMDYFLEKVKVLSRGKKSQVAGKHAQVEIAKSATIQGPVILEKGVRILANAVVIGPTYIGKNTVIATNALVRKSMIGENCVVGFLTEIARSHLGNNVWTHSNYIGDSIIGDDTSFGAGTVTGNLRLDEATIKINIQGTKIDSGRNKFGLVTGEHVRCGINTSFMPGVKIGNNSFIGAGIVLTADVPDGRIVYGKTKLLMKENTAKAFGEGREAMKKKLEMK